jgi:integrase/recombinase XerC
MSDIIDKYLQYIKLELNLSSHTQVAYGNDLRQWEQFLTGGSEPLDVASVTSSDIRAWLLQLSDSGDSARTLRRKVQAVRSFYKWLMRNGTASVNPASSVELARIPKRLPQLVREDSVNTLLDSEVDETDFEQVRNRLIVMMLYETGMRRAELIGLLDKNVDTAKGELKVHGKRDKDRIIPFGTELADWIERYRALRNEQARGCESFFVRDNGEPLYAMLVYRVVREALGEAGVTSKRSPHVLRHTFATAMLNDGAELNSVKELLGHESLATTQIYTHVTFSELKHNYKLAHPRALKKGG